MCATGPYLNFQAAQHRNVDAGRRAHFLDHCDAPPAPHRSTSATRQGRDLHVRVGLGGPRARWQQMVDPDIDLDSFSYYQLLGVSSSASDDEISDAFYELARVAHPDRHVREREDKRKRAIDLVYARMSEAFRVLSDPELRPVYDGQLRSGAMRLRGHLPGPPRIRTRDPRTPKARKLYDKAQQLVRDNNLLCARSTLELALQFEPTSVALRTALEQISSAPPQHPRSTGAVLAEPAAQPVPPAETSPPVTVGADASTPAAPPGHPAPRATQRRRAPRHDLIHPMRVRCRNWSEFRTLYTRDISSGGVFLCTTTPLPVGTAVQISLALPNERTVELRAKVVHVASSATPDATPGMGLRFLDLTDEQRAHIDALLRVAAAAEGQNGDNQVLRQLMQELSRLRAASAHVALRVPPDADPDLVRKAYLHLAKRCHPDLFGRYSGEAIQDAASEIFFLIRRAYERLRDTESRAVKGPPTDHGGPSAVASARNAWLSGDYAGATVCLRRAVDADPESPLVRAAYHVAAGAASLSSGNATVARKHFETALVFDSGCQPALNALTSGEIPRDAAAMFDSARPGDDSP